MIQNGKLHTSKHHKTVSYRIFHKEEREREREREREVLHMYSYRKMCKNQFLITNMNVTLWQQKQV